MSTRTYAEPKPASENFAPAKSGLLQRGSAGLTGQCAGSDKSRLTLQRDSANQFETSAALPIPPLVHDVLRSPGQSLDGDTRAFMEPRLGHDFSRVRVHTDARAAESARAMDARAYTVGQDIVFGAGRYAPGTSQGRRLMAHELTHVVQQRQSPGVSSDAEPRARNAASQVAGGGFVAPEMIGQAPLGINADDGKEKETSSSAADSSAFKLGKVPGPPLAGTLKVSSWLVSELIKQGQLSQQMQQLIESGQIEIKPDEKSASTATGNATGGAIGSTPGGATGMFATDFNTLPNRFFGKGSLGFGAASSDLQSGPKVTPPPTPTPQWVLTGGYFDPVIGYIPRHFVKWTPPTPSAPQPAGEPNWVQKSLADLKTSFDFSDGLTISSISNPGVSTSIFVTGITSRTKTKGGVGVQTELGWDKSMGLQLSYQNWYLHGSLDTDGKWGISLSFPNDAPLPVLPWINDIFREGGVAIQGFANAAAAGPPDLKNLDPLVTQLTPHVSRMKGAVDAAKGIAKAQPGVNVSLTVGSGPRPGATPSDKPSGFFVGGTFIATF
jgi:hypothetical protein